MTPERWQHIEEIFQSALDLPPEERERFVADACTGDIALQREVETLLTRYGASGTFVEAPIGGKGALALSSLWDDDDDPMIGTRMGSYVIEREIGRGGMGAVYLASRADNAFQKRVAIKVVKRGMDTDFILSRFRRERQIVAALEHVNIARILDGGATSDGRPYFVMEYIEGEPFYHYCDSRRLGVRERLRLFCNVCDAVGYAHLKQVIHGDIKPSNILVDNSGAPKLFDFGIAKVLDPELASDTAPQTATAMRLMTVEYASPEQVQGLPVTFLSDLYSLGVLLYELLTGHRPYRFRSRALHEMARVICDEEPEYPSIAVHRSDNMLPIGLVDKEAITISHVCEMRCETPESLRRELTGSLDNIAMKVLRKEPGERYQSAAALREDIARFLDGVPVSAPAYVSIDAGSAFDINKTRKKPHGISVAVLPFKLIGPTGGGPDGQLTDTGDSYLGVGLADALITRLSNIQRFIVRPTSSVLQYTDTADAIRAGNELDVDYVIDGNIRRSGKTLRVTAQLLSSDEGATRWSGRFDEGLADVLQLEDILSKQIASALIPQLTAEEQQQLAKRGTSNTLALEAYLRGRYHWHSLTEDGFSKAIEDYNRAVKLDPRYALAYAAIAEYYIFLGIYGVMPFAESSGAAKEAAQKAIDLDDTLAEAHAALAFAHVTYGFNWRASEAHHRRAIELNPNSSTAHNWYAFILLQQGRFDEAIAEVERAYELDPITALVQQSRAWCRFHSRRFDEAIEIYEKLITSQPNFAWGRVTYSWALIAAGMHTEAVEQAEKAVETGGERQVYLTGLCGVYAAAGRHDDARRLLSKLQDMATTSYVSPYLMALIYCHLGEREQSLNYLDYATTIGDAWVSWLLVDPQVDPLRGDPRFAEIIAKTHNPGIERITHANVNTGPTEKSLAVLPFKLINVSVSDTGDEKYLGTGLADALITRLSNVRRINVRPTSSIARFAKEDSDPVEAGRALGVSHVLDGRIQRAGERVRVTVQLVDMHTQTPVWARRFDEEFTDVFTIQDTISEHVAELLVPQLTGDERRQLTKRGTNDPEAFEAYMRGRYYWSTQTAEGFAKSKACFVSAVARDPNYAAPYAGIAEYKCWLAVYGLMPPGKCLEEAREAAQRAIALDDSLADAHTAHALALLANESQWSEASVGFRHALELNPNYAPAHIHYACQLGMEGRFDQSIAEARRASELDPLNPFNPYIVAWCLYQARRYDEAIKEAKRLLNAEPNYGSAYFVLSWLMREKGNSESAIANAKRAIELTGDVTMLSTSLGSAYVLAGKHEEARAILAELNAQAEKKFVSPYHRALLHIHLGEHDRALNLLGEAIDASDPWIAWFAVEPQLDPLRGDPRFTDLLRRTANPAARPLVLSETTGDQKSIAVLPFKLLGKRSSDDTGEEYLGVGLADALITRLSNVQCLTVRPTSSILRYGGEDVDAPAAGRKLAVQYVLDGRIKRAANRIRISLQLLDVPSGASVWAHQLDEQFTDLLALDDAISERVSEAVALRLTGENRRQLNKRGTDSPEAFEAYVRGRYYWSTFTEEGFAKALISYNRAVAYAPDYALAYTGIAEYYTLLGVYSVLPFADTSAAAKEAAQKAVSLDDTLPEAHSVLGLAYLMHDFDWERADYHLSHALELNPKYAQGNSWYCYFLGMCGRFTEAIEKANRAVELDPLTPFIQHALGWACFHAREYDEGLEAFGRLLANEPNYGMAYVLKSLLLARQGKYDEAISAGEKSVALLGRSSYTLVWLASTYAEAGQTVRAQELLSELHAMAKVRYVSPYLLAMVYCMLDERDEAFRQLERAREIRDVRLAWLGVDPQMDRLRDDPRVNEILVGINHPLAEAVAESKHAKDIGFGI